MLKVGLFFIILFLGGLQANAQLLVKITGVVTDEQKKPLSLVTVTILGQNQITLTDINGTYSLYANTTSFTIKYNLLGYNPVSLKFNEKKGARITKNLTLANNINELEQVTVTNKQNQLSNSTTINIADFPSLPSVSGNFESILKTLPGVSVNNELSSQYSVRGGNFDENLIYVNDVEISRPVLIRNAQQEGLSFINADLVTRAKFSAGGFEAKYGDKLSSVLDIRYDKPDSNNLTLTAGLLGTALTSKQLYKNSFFLAGLRYKNNSSLLNTQDQRGNYAPNFTDVQLLYQYNFSPKFSLSAIGNFNSGKFNLIPENRETQFGTLNTLLRLKIDYTGQEIDNYQTVGGAVSAIFSPKPNLLIKWINSYFNTIERERFDIEGNYIFDELEPDFGGTGFTRVKVNRGIGTYLNYGRNSLNSQTASTEIKVEKNYNSHIFSLGLRLENNTYTDELNEYNITDSAGYILPNNSKKIIAQNVVNVKNNLTINNFSAYAQDSYSLAKNIDLQIGFRANYSSISEEILISPRLLFAYRPTSNNKIFRFTAGIYNQPPSYRSLRENSGLLNLNQKAQRSYNTSLGFDYAFDGLGTRLKFTSEAYYKYSGNLIPYQVDNMRINYLASQTAKANTYGADFTLGGEFVKDLVSYFRVSFMKANQDILGDYKIVKNAQGNPSIVYPGYLKRPTDQRVNFSIFFQDRLLNSPTYKVHLNLLYGSRLPVSAPEAESYSDDFRIPAYKRVDIGFSKDFLDDVTLRKPKLLNKYFSSFITYFEIFNLLNINNTVSYLWLKDVDNVQYAIPNYLTGRQFNVKLILKFKNH